MDESGQSDQRVQRRGNQPSRRATPIVIVSQVFAVLLGIAMMVTSDIGIFRVLGAVLAVTNMLALVLWRPQIRR